MINRAVGVLRQRSDCSERALVSHGWQLYRLLIKCGEFHRAKNIGIKNEGQSMTVHYLRAVGEVVMQDYLRGRRPR